MISFLFFIIVLAIIPNIIFKGIDVFFDLIEYIIITLCKKINSIKNKIE